MVAPFLADASVIIVLVLTVASITLLTARDPTESSHAEGVTARRVARTALILFVGAVVVWIALGFGGVIRDFFEILVCAMAIFGLVAAIATLEHLRTLLRSVPRQDLAVFARLLCWALLPACAVMAAGALLSWSVSYVMRTTTTLSTVGYVGSGSASASLPVLTMNQQYTVAFGIAQFITAAGGYLLLLVLPATAAFLFLAQHSLLGAARQAAILERTSGSPA